mmetsp:Transcript_20739/g.64456  ORF Transcript_20739/g.64456 Transcript_20739/m.64456 type:complete len:277 (+) Transcript_20739:367-1197(+)
MREGPSDRPSARSRRSMAWTRALRTRTSAPSPTATSLRRRSGSVRRRACARQSRRSGWATCRAFRPRSSRASKRCGTRTCSRSAGSAHPVSQGSACATPLAARARLMSNAVALRRRAQRRAAPDERLWTSDSIFFFSFVFFSERLCQCATQSCSTGVGNCRASHARLRRRSSTPRRRAVARRGDRHGLTRRASRRRIRDGAFHLEKAGQVALAHGAYNLLRLARDFGDVNRVELEELAREELGVDLRALAPLRLKRGRLGTDRGELREHILDVWHV